MLGPSTALVIEARARRAELGEAPLPVLRRLLARLRTQSRGLASLDEVVLVHDGLAASAQAELAAVAGVPLQFVQVPEGTGYYAAKNLGFEATRTDVVAFTDLVCAPSHRWLERLLAPFDDARVEAVAGKTTYGDGLLAHAATALDFLQVPSPLGAGCVRNFFACNVAFRRELFEAYRYQTADRLYRGHCQVVGLRLHADGVKVHAAPGALTVHALPRTSAALLEQRLIRGADGSELTPLVFKALLPAPLAWLGGLFPIAVALVLTVRFALAALELVRQPREPLGAIAGAAVLSALDLAGALGRRWVRRPSPSVPSGSISLTFASAQRTLPEVSAARAA